MTTDKDDSDSESDLSVSESLGKDLGRHVQVLETIKGFENQLSMLLSTPRVEEGGAATRIPELVDEERENLRLDLARRLQNLFSSSKSGDQFFSRLYEEAIYLLLMDRITRYFGYYQGISRAVEEIQQRNAELGDPNAMTVEFSSFQRLLMGMDEVHFIRTLGVSLGLDPDDLEKIVSYTIDKEFAPIRKSND